MPTQILLVATVGWPSAARYASGFNKAGCLVDAMAPKDAPVAKSRYLRRFHAYRALRPLRSLKHAIDEARPDLIVPCDDRVVTHLLKLAAIEGTTSELTGLIARSLGRLKDYERLLSRYDSLMALRRAGVRIAETRPIGNESELRAQLPSIGLPAVLKSDGSWGGDGVVIVDTVEQAVRAYKRLAFPPSRPRSVARAFKRNDMHFLHEAITPKRPNICIQRFIEGGQAASGFAAWQGAVVGSVHYDVIEADGSIGPPRVIRRVDSTEMETASKAAARLFGLSGLHGIDYIRDAQGEVHVIEVNPRATQGGTLPFGTGHDLPAALAGAITGAMTEIRRPIENDTVVFFPGAWLRDPSNPHFKTGHHDVPWDDPAVLSAILATHKASRKSPPAKAG